MVAYTDAEEAIMLSTTLRLPDDLAGFLEAQAKAEAISINAWVTRVLEAERERLRKQQLARDWAAYAADATLQDVAYALPAQGEVAAESSVPHRPGRPAPARRRGGKP